MALFDDSGDFFDFGEEYGGTDPSDHGGYGDSYDHGAEGYVPPSSPQQQVMSTFQPQITLERGDAPSTLNIPQEILAGLLDIGLPGGGPGRMFGKSPGRAAVGAMSGMFGPGQGTYNPGGLDVLSNTPQDTVPGAWGINASENQTYGDSYEPPKILPPRQPMMMAPPVPAPTPPVAPAPPPAPVGGFPGWPDWQGEFAPRPWMGA